MVILFPALQHVSISPPTALKPAAIFLITSKCFITVSVGMVRAIRCHRQKMKTSIINGSEASRLSVAIQALHFRDSAHQTYLGCRGPYSKIIFDIQTDPYLLFSLYSELPGRAANTGSPDNLLPGSLLLLLLLQCMVVGIVEDYFSRSAD